jgi:HSP20 family protein
MADPQTNTQTDQTRAKDNAAQAASAGEPRSFDEAGRGGGAAQGAGEIARTADEAGRRIAEAGMDASRTALDTWRRTLDPFLAMQLDVNRWFDDLWRQSTGFDSIPALRMMRPFGHMAAMNPFAPPPADLKETKDAHLISIELPGLAKDDVEITLQGDALTVRGQKIEESEDATCAYRVSERRFGRFERSFPLPLDVDRNRIQAQFRDGVLKIVLPKRAEVAAQHAKIEIRP